MALTFLKLKNNLFDPIDPAAISLFRVFFGATVLFHLWEQFFFAYDKFIKPDFFFSYPYLDFIQPLPAGWVFFYFLVMALAALGILFGTCYRFCALAFWLMYSYLFLIDVSYYKNHFYLIALVSFLMIFINAHSGYSLGRRGRSLPQYQWQIWILRFQFCVVYFFAGIAKINGDWFAGEPVAGILRQRFASTGLFQYDGVINAYIFGGLFFDLLIPFFLLNKRTRKYAAAVAVLFHTVNLVSFPNIRVFVLLSMASVIIFFEPDWPRRLFKFKETFKTTGPQEKLRLVTKICLSAYILIQLTLPLRHFFYPGDILWTAQGERFAWRMVLKRMRAVAAFKVVDPKTGDFYFIDPQKELSRRQYLNLITTPGMILTYAHHLKNIAKDHGIDNAAVYVDVQATLNGRPLQQMIDPSVDLTQFTLEDDFTKWVVPFNNSPSFPF